LSFTDSAPRRRPRWRQAVAAAAALAALASAPTAHAMSGGFIPSDTNPPKVPGTAVVDSAWKNTGTFNVAGQGWYECTVALVGARWVLGVEHCAPGRGSTVYFHGGRYTAEIVGTKAIGRPSDDMSISLLDRAIPAPPGGYLQLLEDPLYRATMPQLGGWYLATGMGGAGGSTPTAAWLSPTGTTSDGSPQPTVVGMDSGGVRLWRRSVDVSKPAVIAGNHTLSTPPQPQLPISRNDFSTPILDGKTYGDVLRAEIAQLLAEHPGEVAKGGTEAPDWTTLAELGVNTASLRPALPQLLKVVKEGSALTASWSAPDGPAPTSYEVSISGRTTPISVPATQRTLTLPTPAEGEAVDVRVVARNDNGLSAPTWRWFVEGTTLANFIDLEAPPVRYREALPPRTIESLSATTRARGLRPYAVGDQTLTYCMTSTWTHSGDRRMPDGGVWPLSPWYSLSLDGQAVNLSASNVEVSTSNDSLWYVVEICGLGAGESHTVVVKTARGVERSIAATTPTGLPAGTVLAAAKNVAPRVYRSTAGGQTDYCAAVDWMAPAAPAGVTLTTRYVFNPGRVRGTVLTGAPTTAKTCGFEAGEQVKISINAEYSGPFTISALAELTVTVPAGAPAGTTLPSPGVPTITAEARNVGGKVDYCATVTFAPAPTVDGFPVDAYEVMVTPSDWSTAFWPTVTGSGTTRKAEQCGLAPGATYTAIVSASYRPPGGTPSTKRSQATAPATTPAGPPTGSSWGTPAVLLSGSFMEDGLRCQSFLVFWTDPTGFTADRFVALLRDSSGAFVDRQDVPVNGLTAGAVCGITAGQQYELQFSVRLQPASGGTPVHVTGIKRFTAS
jgi:hypothetical protein